MPLYKMLLARFTSIQLFKMLVNHTFYGLQQYVRTDGISQNHDYHDDYHDYHDNYHRDYHNANHDYHDYYHEA